MKKIDKKKMPIVACAVVLLIILAIIIATFANRVTAKFTDHSTVCVGIGETVQVDFKANKVEQHSLFNGNVSYLSPFSEDTSLVITKRIDDKSISVTGKKVGSTNIALKLGIKKKTYDTVQIIVEKNMKAVCQPYENEAYSNHSDDYSWISLDTNPHNSSYTSSLYFSAVELAIADLNEKFGFDDSVYEKMKHTRALDGIQKEETDSVELSWTYHPDKGLEVIYSLK